jgi:hypothetical protein
MKHTEAASKGEVVVRDYSGSSPLAKSRSQNCFITI